MFDLFGSIQGRRAKRQKDRGVIECALRDKNNVTSLLGNRWRHGEAQLFPGRIVLKSFMPLGFRIQRPFTESIEIQVLKVSEALETALGWNFGGTVYEIETPQGVIEWGLGHVTDHKWAISTVLATEVWNKG